ncbi:hypothetical protein LTR36_010074 [Oleoguttula mirabilis]|uniref:NACHT domain-containing protein n=1 Tax=Oleoguttula mirabilis TaxID=1507867 RepID=A0AAV9JSI3_9PEZI|nr:hypothetical protein LTR36_010074 [Oleoguttula mirabilis]
MPDNEFTSLWDDAREEFADASGKDLKDLPMPQTTEELIKSVESQNKGYKDFREKQGLLFTVLSAAVKPIELVGNLAAGAASAVFPPSSMCLGAVMYLINAAHGVSASLDAITDMLGVLKDFTVRLSIYNRESLSVQLREKLTEVLTTVIEIFARSTKVIKEGVVHRLKSFGKNVLLGNDQKMQGLIAKLDKLTQGEDRLVGAETLVETKKTGRNVQDVQSTLTETTKHLSQLTVTQTEVSQGVGQILSAMENQAAQIKEEKDTKHLETVKKVLKPSNTPQDRFDEIKREHVHGSGDWILAEGALQAWVASKDPIIWVSGNPGSGKSFLTYTVIAHLQDLEQEHSDSTVHASIAYFFFRDNKDQTRSFAQALRDIAFQIAQNDQLYAKHVAAHTPEDVASIRSAWHNLFVDFYLQDGNGDRPAFLLLDGIDEAFEEDRVTFLELLKDVENAGSGSRLHVAMIGRPQIIDEILDQLETNVSTIHVDWTKNGSDVAHYVEISIAKSRVLHRVSRKLKDEIVQTLTSKAGGMFMWVKLMVAELGKKSRESAIRDALTKAPKGLTEMLQHVLEGFSASLTEEDAQDLNDMLLWVALAKRPLALGDVDTMLRLKSEEGEGIIYLEGKLRKQFASFFTLTRDDCLTTADLQAPKRVLDDRDELDEDTAAGAEAGDGLNDVENETDFDSNPAKTTVTFSHASISDFFRDPKHGKVVCKGDDHPAVGVDLASARIQVTRTCLDLMVDISLYPRMIGSVSLLEYASQNWKEHLEDLRIANLDLATRSFVATMVARMLQEDSLLQNMDVTRPYTFFTEDCARLLASYLTDADIIATLPAETASWVHSTAAAPLELFEPAMRYFAKKWLLPDYSSGWNMIVCATQIWAYMQRREGKVLENLSNPSLSAEELTSAAEWAGFEQTAYWHRMLAIVLRETNHTSAALQEFQKVLQMDDTLWTARVGIARVKVNQGKFREALELDAATLALAEKDDQLEESVKRSHLQQVHKRMGQCYESILDGIGCKETCEVAENVRLMQLAFSEYKQAFVMSFWDYESLLWCFNILRSLAKLSDGQQGHRNPPRHDEDEGKHLDTPNTPSPHEYYERIMGLSHTIANSQKDDLHTHLTSCLYQYRYSDEDFFEVLALAAMQTGQVKWLQARYKDAVVAAHKDRLTVTAACLNLCLAQLYTTYSEEEEHTGKAVRIWETIGTEGSATTREATDIAWARDKALESLGTYCICKAFACEDEQVAERWVHKLEHYTAQKASGNFNWMAIYLATWYQKQGRSEDARQLVKPMVMESISILSDDDPTNDPEGYANLVIMFLAIGDDVNVLALCHSERQYVDGITVLVGDIAEEERGVKHTVQGADGKDETAEGGGDDEAGNDDDGSGAGHSDDDDGDDTVGSCDGICGDDFDNWDGVTWCRYCGWSFCTACLQLVQNNELPMRICGAHHEFLFVPPLRQKFKKGEVLVGDRVMSAEEWKAGVKQQWGL